MNLYPNAVAKCCGACWLRAKHRPAYKTGTIVGAGLEPFEILRST
ncbi:MAG: hypothetical protein U5L04_07480 [Trueperaceae bacterium]|nr:hypothetical protein [Trueperaceae bacterium]